MIATMVSVAPVEQPYFIRRKDYMGHVKMAEAVDRAEHRFNEHRGGERNEPLPYVFRRIVEDVEILYFESLFHVDLEKTWESICSEGWVFRWDPEQCFDDRVFAEFLERKLEFVSLIDFADRRRVRTGCPINIGR